jgi:ribosomal protein S18 acetylase RimI-like enzyme
VTQGTSKVWARQAQLNDARDAQEYRRLLNAYASDPFGRGAALSEEHLFKVTRDLEAHPSAWTYLAGVESKSCAFATCFCGYSTFYGRPLFNVHDVAVLAGFRGLGIGRALLRFITEDARRLGCCKVTLEVREDNRAANGLYRSEGFGASKIAGEASVQYLFLEKTLCTAVIQSASTK